MGVVMKRAQYFLTVPDHRPQLIGRDPAEVRRRIGAARPGARPAQLSLFAPTPVVLPPPPAVVTRRAA